MRNVLLAGVPPHEIRRLDLSRTDFQAGECVQSAGLRIERVYFPESGLVSLMSGPGDRRVEAAIVGREGMIGSSALLGTPVSSHHAVVRVAGAAWALPKAELKTVREHCPELYERLLGFVSALTAQMEQTICAIGRCTVEQRLARWLLMAHDRLNDDDLEITHDCLATMLGVRRPGVTVALHILEGELAVRSKRGRVTIRDRDCLKGLAGPAYYEPAIEVGPRHSPRIRQDGALSDYEPAAA